MHWPLQATFYNEFPLLFRRVDDANERRALYEAYHRGDGGLKGMVA